MFFREDDMDLKTTFIIVLTLLLIGCKNSSEKVIVMNSRTSSIVNSNHLIPTNIENLPFKNIPKRIIFKESYVHKSLGINRNYLDLYKPEISVNHIYDTKILEVRPHKWLDNKKAIIYVHGDQNIFSSLKNVIPLAHKTKMRIICIKQNYDTSRNSVYNSLNITKYLLDDGYKLNDIVFYGIGKGSEIAFNSVVNLINSKNESPGALIISSPYSSNSNIKISENCCKLLPPILIQTNTKNNKSEEIVSFYQEITNNNDDLKIDNYDGLIISKNSDWKNNNHKKALKTVNQFIRQKLDF